MEGGPSTLFFFSTLHDRMPPPHHSGHCVNHTVFFLKLIRYSERPAGSAAKMFIMLAKKKLVGHARDVIANDDVARFHMRKFFIESRH